MSTSPGGKVLWMSPCCKAPVRKMVIFTQFSYMCSECEQWGPWRSRLKISARKLKPNTDAKWKEGES